MLKDAILCYIERNPVGTVYSVGVVVPQFWEVEGAH